MLEDIIKLATMVTELRGRVESMEADANYYRMAYLEKLHELADLRANIDESKAGLVAQLTKANEAVAHLSGLVPIQAYRWVKGNDNEPTGLTDGTAEKIPTIKAIRTEYGLTLLQAKNLVDAWQAEGKVVFK